MKNIRHISDEILYAAYTSTRRVWKAGKLLEVNPQSLHRRLKNAGFDMSGTGKKWSDEDTRLLMNFYRDGFVKGDGGFDDLVEKTGRTKQYLSRKAREFGLTERNRPISAQHKKIVGHSIKKYIKEQGHPKGATGMRHTIESKAAIGKAAKEHWDGMTEKERSTHVLKGLKTREKNGTLYDQDRKTSWKQGWRTIGGIDKYYRSRWEANYARYLEWLKKQGQIRAWEHEPETFWFGGIMRGVRSYLPDFRVIENNGDVIYHEVKGWMDDRSKTKIKRMAKYHPGITLLVIEAKGYKAIAKQMSSLIEEWE